MVLLLAKNVSRFQTIRGAVYRQRGKGTSSNARLYQPLAIPTRTWECLSIHFFLGLHKTARGYDSVYVVVDRFRKMAHFILCKTTNDASYIAGLFFKEAVRIHRLPLNLASNRDSKFVTLLENFVEEA